MTVVLANDELNDEVTWFAVARLFVDPVMWLTKWWKYKYVEIFESYIVCNARV